VIVTQVQVISAYFRRGIASLSVSFHLLSFVLEHYRWESYSEDQHVAGIKIFLPVDVSG
jgi:hypothetical protein